MLNKCLQVYNEISNELIKNKIPFMVLSGGSLNIITDKATVTVKTSGACILKTNLPNAMGILTQNLLSSTRQIWTGEKVSEYSMCNAKTIVNDIKNLQ